MSELDFVAPNEAQEYRLFTPFTRELGLSVIRDDRGRYVGAIEADTLSEEQDIELTDLIVKLLNDHFASIPASQTLRQICGWYEVEPGWFVYASNREAALEAHGRYNKGADRENYDYGASEERLKNEGLL